MKTKLLIMLLVLLGTVATAEAKFVQEVELSDGTVLEGYIYKQIPGKKIVFQSSRAKKDPSGKYSSHNKEDTLQWNDVKVIRRSSESSPSWCLDKVTLKNGTVYKGQITEQRLGSTMTLLRDDTHKTVEIKYSDLLKMEKVVEDMDKDLWLDRQYTNRLRLNDNTVREGLIVLQYNGATTDDSYLELLRSSGRRERIYRLDIKEYIIFLR